MLRWHDRFHEAGADGSGPVAASEGTLLVREETNAQVL
jgi:hypothetical protein